jgi:hypothetical protein
MPLRNYAPVKKEHVAMPVSIIYNISILSCMDMRLTHNLVSFTLTSQVEVVEGEIPKELYGAFLRNGPNPCFEKAVKRYHWFDGHAMLVCISYYVLLHMIY